MTRRKTLMRAMARARHAWNSHVREIALSEGIPESYRTILMFLYRHPGSSQRSIAEFEGVTTSAINQVVKNMLEEGYLRKETDPSDKRSSKLYLTEAGTAVAVRVREKVDASDDAITAMIGAEKEAELIEFVDKLTDFIRKELR